MTNTFTQGVTYVAVLLELPLIGKIVEGEQDDMVTVKWFVGEYGNLVRRERKYGSTPIMSHK